MQASTVERSAKRATAGPARDARPTGQWRLVARSLSRHPTGLTGGIILGLLIAMAVFAPVVAPYDPLKTAFRGRLVPPTWRHPFGTDNLGRDILSRAIFGARLSLGSGVIAVAISAAGGTLLGVISGYYRGLVDAALMALTDLFLALPGILVSMVFIFSFGPSLTNVAIAVGLASIPYYTRIARGSVLSVREQVYVEAARVVGAPDWEIMIRHVLPNIVAPILVVATLGFGSTILIIASLSFLGLGAQPPTPEWGAIVSDGRSRIATAWWISTFGGVAIMLTVLAVNLLGDALRDALDPRLRRR